MKWPTKPQTIRIKLVPLSAEHSMTHLVCLFCGQFHCQFYVDNGTGEPQAGSHQACMKLGRVKRAVRGTTP
jgi:hypothetical protein